MKDKETTEAFDQLKQFIKAEHKESSLKQKPHQSPKQNINQIQEVDLHIHCLLDDQSGLSPKDMLEIQMSKFRQTLIENRNYKGKRIVFIHGKGNGTLKTELRNELQRKFNYEFMDASFKEYGFGATMVIIK